MVVTCVIEFDENLLGTFYAGQMVSGSVTLKADKPKDVKAIQLKTAGVATTSWSERGFGTRGNYNGREVYLDCKTFLLGSDEDSMSTIRTGTHVYTFAWQLPYNCPSSFEGRNGSVRYVAKVVLIRPWKFDQTYTRGFTVLKTVDLNNDTPQLRVPSHTSAYRTFCCRPCKTEPLQLELHLPQTGYVPGQLVPVKAVIINNTNIPVSEVTFSLVMLVRYFSQLPRKHVLIERIAIAMEKGDSVLAQCTRSLEQELRVPSTPPSCVRLCSIVQIVYHVEVEAKMRGCHGKQVTSMPISIGNVPLWSGSGVVQQQPQSSKLLDKQTTPQQGELPMVTPIGNATAAATSVSTPIHTYPDMPPPNYEEAAHTERGDMNADELHAFGPCPFAPLYPVYDVSSPITAKITETPNGGYDNETYEREIR